MDFFLYVLTTISLGLLIGTEFAVSVFINPVLEKLDRRSQAVAISLFAARLGRAMPFWYGASFLLLISEAAVERHTHGSLLLIVASTIWLAVILLTVLFLVPINNRMIRLDTASFPEAAQQEHRRWDTLHRLRVGALIVAMVCFLWAFAQ